MPETYDLRRIGDPEELARHAGENFPAQPEEAPHAHDTMSVREVEYKGRRIRIETSYRITVDGEPVTGHVMVSNDGSVHYHAIPNQQFESAVDMVKRVIDLTPPDAWSSGSPRDPHPGHGNHQH
jgi:hypothetical protein